MPVPESAAHGFSEECIVVDKASKSFGKRTVLDQVSLSVKKGEIYGLLGPSGSGKTTLVRLITGLDIPDGGSVTLLGEPMPKLSILSRIGYMAQSDALYGELTAQENLSFFASLYGLKGPELDRRMKAVAELVKLSGELKKPVQQFSGGMKRRLSLAVALMHEPEVLVLDEPTVGIDPVLRMSIWEELEGLRQRGVTILVTTHVMDEAEKCDRLAMIRDGHVIATGSPDELKTASGSATMEDAFVTYGGGVR
ncbi:ABC transporter ATP-binding protein [Cohnella yongneupensis]|uniref:ABC transporter ATP-binding protein n=1 Tax=Cohnella yongneupensis TaxID=425006 RepID=A0ABW0R7H3_9BACL